MRWFTHNNNLRNTPQFKAMSRNHHLLGYGAACLVWEVLAQYGKAPDFRLSLKSSPYDLEFWKDELQVANKGTAAILLKGLATAGVIDRELFENEALIAAPLMQGELDDWNKRLLAKKSKQAT
jgi:hypothetical protein